MHSQLASIAGESLRPTFGFSSPYHRFGLVDACANFGRDLFGGKVLNERDLRRRAAEVGAPDFMVMSNFVAERAGIKVVCQERHINVVHTEDGFFPHYGWAHGDPLGFCWESALPGMVFRKCTPSQQTYAKRYREQWLDFKPESLPPTVRKPFVFWPLQLVGDAVNMWDLNAKDWAGLLRHFRVCLPTTYQLVIKRHPRGKPQDSAGIQELVRELPNTVLLPANADLKTLLMECSAAAGANSTVLFEARLMFHKPAYAYARSWFTNHVELFMPIHFRHPPRDLGRFEHVDDNRLVRTDRLDDYADWFLAQLLGRQIDLNRGRSDPAWLRQKVEQLSYHSFINYGEEIFDRYD